ncbi:MAG: AAA family ATPase [Deltaproteobacteria bacterium]|nr:AAA family ATPase [Deltaproteobacteria bacterium]
MDARLRSFLLDPSSYHHAVEAVEHIETHISEIFLAGPQAYKIKKPLKLDFLDFSTLEKRRFYCERELKLNRRFAPELYEEVVAITDKEGSYAFGGEGRAAEYAVKMKRFDDNSLFTELLSRGLLTDKLLSEVVMQIAAFHSRAEHTPKFWGFDEVSRIVRENIAGIKKDGAEIVDLHLVERLNTLFESELLTLKELIERRRQTSVKSLHGDLHLRNIALLEGQPVIFDGIEFSDELSCCDVSADLAFLLMDLTYRGAPDLSNLALNDYLENSGDYEGTRLLPLYLSYRAAVRCKISCIEHATLEEPGRRSHAAHSAVSHLELALKFILKDTPRVIAIGGLSGSGKTTLGRAISRIVNGVHLRSDVIRKQLLGLHPLTKAPESAYSPEITTRTYEAMRRYAIPALEAGYSVVLDAVHMNPAEREAAEGVARKFKIPFLGIWCSTDIATARERVSARTRDASDADQSVIEKQFQQQCGEMKWKVIDTRLSLNKLHSLAQSVIGGELCRDKGQSIKE